jgi:UDP-3-O-acyl-N-acetylglucosamine deacetylase
VGSFSLSTVEHVLSALAGLGVDDAIIETTGPELPAGDGSSLPFVEMIEEAGVAETEGRIEPLRPQSATMVSGSKGECIVCLPSDHLEITVVLDYPDRPFIGTQTAEAALDPSNYREEVAAARTFGFLSELEWLHEHGLGLGATHDNVVVLLEDGYGTKLRYPNELARHKILDLIGDLSLVGRPLNARVIAVKPGHRLNTQMASLLASVK